MEPRPQRPRAQSGQNPQQGPSPDQTAQGPYQQGPDPTDFIAPPRTEYDYSPLDLAPPGQRRRRQLVAAVIGALSALLLGAVIFFSYLLLRDENPPSEQDDVLAAQTEIAERQATLDAEETIIAQAAAEQTQQAENLNPQQTGESDEPVATETATGNDQETQEAPADTAETPQATEEPAAGDDGEQPADGATSEFAGQPDLAEDQLFTLLPEQDVVPETLSLATDVTRTEEEVAGALGGNRLAETNLETWGWSANVERQFAPADPASIDPAATSFISVSIHGFASADACAEALVFFSDIVAENGYEDIDTPDLGDGARMLSQTADDGTTNVALYVQDGAVLYRFGGSSTAGDPAQDVIDAATATLGG